MDGYLLDTNIVGHYESGNANVIARINSLPEDTLLYVSAVTLGEIWFGHGITVSTDLQRRMECEMFINYRFHREMVLPVGRHTRVYYGDLKAELFRQYPHLTQGENHPERCIDRATGAELGIDENDLWIAAQALGHGLILVTNDEMARIRSVSMARALAIEDWTRPM